MEQNYLRCMSAEPSDTGQNVMESGYISQISAFLQVMSNTAGESHRVLHDNTLKMGRQRETFRVRRHVCLCNTFQD